MPLSENSAVHCMNNVSSTCWAVDDTQVSKRIVAEEGETKMHTRLRPDDP